MCLRLSWWWNLIERAERMKIFIFSRMLQDKLPLPTICFSLFSPFFSVKLRFDYCLLGIWCGLLLFQKLEHVFCCPMSWNRSNCDSFDLTIVVVDIATVRRFDLNFLRFYWIPQAW